MSQEPIVLGGQWGIAILMVVLASWIIFRTLVPKSFKEWRNAGLLQAFVIALYAEMYGFPLTVYVLTSVLGFDIPWLHVKGHLWATLLGYGDSGAMIEMILGYGFVIVGLTLLFRGWKQVFQAQKQDKLVLSELYQHVRHPQYTGIFLALFGQMIHWPTVLTLILFPVVVVAYYHLAKKEERALVQRFGSEYAGYARQVPMFFPTFRQLRAIATET